MCSAQWPQNCLVMSWGPVSKKRKSGDHWPFWWTSRPLTSHQGESMQKKAIVYCQHLAGIGHLVRSTELARALSADGWEVLLICGGKLPTDFPFPPSIIVEKLKAIESDPEDKSIFPCGSESSLDEIEREPTIRLLELYASFQTDLLLTAMFPFGRQKFSLEFLP